MARIVRKSPTQTYFAAADAVAAAGDENACFPTAIAILADIPVERALAAFAEAGRQQGKGTPFFTARKACELLGYRLERQSKFWMIEMIATYPGVHKNLKNITSRHPVRFAKQWAGQSVMLHMDRHVAAVKDGVMHDWSVNRAKHVLDVYKLVKI